MSAVKLGDVVIYEGRECQITKLTEDTAELTNLKPKGNNDWTKMRVSIKDVEEDRRE